MRAFAIALVLLVVLLVMVIIMSEAFEKCGPPCQQGMLRARRVFI
jgi:hypothetical protein